VIQEESPNPGLTAALSAGPVGAVSSFIHLGMNWATLNNTPFRRYKHFTHEGGVATPLIAHWPQGIRPHSAAGSFTSRRT
jgi:arylsulfatase A-like enzyme